MATFGQERPRLGSHAPTSAHRAREGGTRRDLGGSSDPLALLDPRPQQQDESDQNARGSEGVGEEEGESDSEHDEEEGGVVHAIESSADSVPRDPGHRPRNESPPGTLGTFASSFSTPHFLQTFIRESYHF